MRRWWSQEYWANVHERHCGTNNCYCFNEPTTPLHLIRLPTSSFCNFVNWKLENNTLDVSTSIHITYLPPFPVYTQEAGWQKGRDGPYCTASRDERLQESRKWRSNIPIYSFPLTYDHESMQKSNEMQRKLRRWGKLKVAWGKRGVESWYDH